MSSPPASPSVGRGSDVSFTPARCWGRTALSDPGVASHNASRQYWWSLRGIHVDPDAPLSNAELGELKSYLLHGANFTWSRAGAGARPANATSSAYSAGSIDANGTEWRVIRPPPAPGADSVREVTADLLIEAKSANQSEETVAGLAIALLLLVLGVTIVIGAWLKRRRVSWLHQAGAALLLGVAGGLYMISASLGAHADLVLSYGDYLVFDTEFFFLFLLPPIIFESGYRIDADPFFRNLGKILYFAFVGTVVAALAFGLGMWILGALGLSHPFSFVNAMMFGTVVGATDPVTVLAIFSDLRVDPDLFAVVFGESVMNDAVAVVLYRAMYALESGGGFTPSGVVHAAWAFFVVFLGSTAVGVGIGLASALFFKRVKLAEPASGNGDANGDANGDGNGDANGNSGSTNIDPDRKRRDRSMSAEEAVRGATLEASVVALFPWIAYMLAEALELVGIVSILFCGVVMGHYTRRNLSEGGRALTLGAFGLMAQLSETFVFIYIGASVFLAQPRYFATAAWTVVMCLASRAVAVYPGAKLINGRAAGAGSNPTHAAAGTSASDGFRVGAERAAAAIFGGGAPIPDAHAHMLWFSGLRGAMAFALALEAAARRGDDGHAMLTGTLGAVLFTVLVVGGFVVPALEHLGIRATRGGANGANGANGGGTFGDAGGSSSDARSEDEVAVLIRSEKSDGAASKRSRGVVVGGGAGGGHTSRDATADEDEYGRAVRDSFRSIDERFLTPYFTLDEGEAAAGEKGSSGGDGGSS